VAAPTMLYASDKLTGKKPPALNTTLLLRSCIEKSWSSVEVSCSSVWRSSNFWTTFLTSTSCVASREARCRNGQYSYEILRYPAEATGDPQQDFFFSPQVTFSALPHIRY